MSKESIRKRIEDAKKDAAKVIAKGNLPEEATLLIKSNVEIMDIVLTVLLEKKTRKNSSNSGLPPSHDFTSNGNRNKKDDVKKKEVGEQLENSRTKKVEKTLSPDECSNCGKGLDDIESIKEDKRKLIDIVYEIQETEVTAETKQCPDCGEKTKAEFPQGFEGKIQYGIGIKAAIINFLVAQMMSLARVQEHFKGLLGRCISQAAMLKHIISLSQSLEEWEKQTVKQLLEAKVIYADETGQRVSGKNNWIHSYSSEDIVLQFIHQNRGLEAMEEIGILPKYEGIIVHDCWASYFAYSDADHALCISHLLRELKFTEDSIGHKWATRLKRLLKKAVLKVGKRKKKRLGVKAYQQLRNDYLGILSEALLEMPSFPEANGNKGRIKHTDEQNLWHRLMDYESSILMFARVTEVDATNNRAERDLRMNKVKKKVSGCFRSFEMAKHFCRIYSYLKTMRNKGYSSLQAITLALKGEIPA